jgi:LysR family transcriptional regulator, regulator of abg operon
VLQSQSALTLLTCLTNSDLLAMAPEQWVNSPIAAQLLRTIPVKEDLSGVTIIVVTRRDVPLAPAAGYLLDLMKRTAGHLIQPARRAG